MFNNFKWKLELLMYDLQSISVNISDTIKDIQDGIDDAVNEFMIMKKEISEDFKEAIVEDAYNIDANLGEYASTVKMVTDILDDQKENFRETLGNALHLYKGKVLVDEPKLADHLYISGIADLYTHHGLYVGDGKVIHFAKRDIDSIYIHETTLEEFSKGKPIYVLSKGDSPIRYSAETVVYRAKTRMNEEDYNLANNNCENFVRWCRFGGELDYMKMCL